MRWWAAISALVLAAGCSGKSTREAAPANPVAQSGAGGATGDCSSYLFTDADGDGVGVAPYVQELDTCTTSPPPGFALKGGDCDDADPSRWQYAALDADGDGTVENSTTGCFGELPPGYVTRMWDEDCDDGDPALWKIYHRDDDGDGLGADGSEAEICAGGEVPAGYAALPGDCDDGDPLRNHLAAEQWGDGFDSDCNGLDDPFECPSEVLECPCSALSALPAETQRTCPGGGFDLGLSVLQRCVLCGPETVFVRVTNTGNQPSSAFRIDVELMPTMDGRSTDLVPPPIVLPSVSAGGELSPILLPPVWPIAVARIESDGDCHPSNNTLIVDSSYAECLLR